MLTHLLCCPKLAIEHFWVYCQLVPNFVVSIQLVNITFSTSMVTPILYKKHATCFKSYGYAFGSRCHWSIKLYSVHACSLFNMSFCSWVNLFFVAIFPLGSICLGLNLSIFQVFPVFVQEWKIRAVGCVTKESNFFSWVKKRLKRKIVFAEKIFCITQIP